MLSFFGRNYITNSLMLFVYALVLHLPNFFYRAPSEVINSLFFDQSNLSTGFVWLDHLVTVFVIFMHAAYINRLVIHHRLMRSINLYPGVFYILLMSFTPANEMLHVLLIVNTIALFTLNLLFRSYKILSENDGIFNGAVLTGLNGLVYIPYLPFVLFYLLAIRMLRRYKAREHIQILLAFLAPLFVVGVWYYWKDIPGVLYSELFQKPFGLFAFGFQPADYPVLSLFLILIAVSFLWYNRLIRHKNLQAIVKINVLVWFLIFVLLTAIIISDLRLSHSILATIPLSVFSAIFVSNFRKMYWSELFHGVLFLFSFLVNLKLI